MLWVASIAMKRRQIHVKFSGWIRPSYSYSSFNTQLISINYLLYRNNNLSMPRQTINQLSRSRKDEKKLREFFSPSCVSKDDSFINEHLIPKKANDDRWSLNWNFRSKTSGNWITKLNVGIWFGWLFLWSTSKFSRDFWIWQRLRELT